MEKRMAVLVAIAIVVVSLGCTTENQSQVEQTIIPESTPDKEPEPEIQETIETDPKEAQTYYAEGFTLYKQGKYLDALEKFDKASQIDPNFADAWYNKAVTLSTLGRYEEAIQSYDKVISIDPNHTKAWWNKGVILNKIGKYEESQACFERAKQLDPSLENIET